jgi:hypothetical protein
MVGSGWTFSVRGWRHSWLEGGSRPEGEGPSREDASQGESEHSLCLLGTFSTIALGPPLMFSGWGRMWRLRHNRSHPWLLPCCLEGLAATHMAVFTEVLLACHFCRQEAHTLP